MLDSMQSARKTDLNVFSQKIGNIPYSSLCFLMSTVSRTLRGVGGGHSKLICQNIDFPKIVC